jgi:CcmD family protein
MEPLLLVGYTTIFGLLFGYIWRLHRRLDRLDRRIRSN